MREALDPASPEPTAPPSGDRTWHVVLEPRRGFPLQSPAQIWRHRDLLGLLAWRNIAVRYKQTAFGVAWAVVQPVAISGVLSLFLGSMLRSVPGGVSYFAFTLSGTLPWTLFQNSVGGASMSLIENPSLITKVFFPRILIPLAAILGAAADFLVAALLLGAGLTLTRGLGLGAAGMMAIAAMGLVLLAGGMGISLAAVNVRYRDVRFLVPFFLQCLMFATPVFFPADQVSPDNRVFLLANPVAGWVELFRSGVLGTPVPLDLVLASVLWTLAAVGTGLMVFAWLEQEFADVI